jgi:hypothetical protein
MPRTIAPLNSAPLTRAILALFDGAEESQRVDGELWYQTALADCESLAREFNLTTVQAVGVVAALSPNLRWDRNILAARNVLSGRASTAYPANEFKARRIQSGEAPLDVLGGLKVRAFFQNILSGGFDRAVTIDGHAFNAAYGLVQPVKQARITPRDNLRLQTAYRTAARLRGVTAPAMQATVWIVWRELVLGGTRWQDVDMREAA